MNKELQLCVFSRCTIALKSCTYSVQTRYRGTLTSLCSSPKINPAISGATPPIIFEAVFDIPKTIPAYFPAISIGFAVSVMAAKEIKKIVRTVFVEKNKLTLFAARIALTVIGTYIYHMFNFVFYKMGFTCG